MCNVSVWSEHTNVARRALSTAHTLSKAHQSPLITSKRTLGKTHPVLHGKLWQKKSQTKQPSFGNGLPNTLKKVKSIKKFIQKVKSFMLSANTYVRISSLVSNVMNYYSVTDNIFQLIVDFWHMLLVNDDDDVGFSLVFFVRLCYVLQFLKVFYVYVCVWVC